MSQEDREEVAGEDEREQSGRIGQSLSKPTLEDFTFADDVDVSSADLDCTIDTVIKLLNNAPYNNVGRLVYDKSVVRRLIQTKVIRVKGERVPAVWHVDSQTHATAIAHYLLTATDNTEPCRQCKSERSTGPMAQCIAGGKDVVRGACFNCYYSGSGQHCSFRKGSCSHNQMSCS